MGKRLTIANRALGALEPKHAAFVIEYVKDCSPRRAAEATGHAPDTGYKLLENIDIQDAIADIMQERLEEVGIDASWILFELVDNHRIARQQGNISASNTALKILAQLAVIDAMASQRLDHMSSDKSMSAIPYIDADTAKQIAKHLEEELSPPKEISFF